MERGVFRLNDEFIKNTINKLNNEDSNDLLFKYELLCNYQNRKKCFEIMREHNEYVEYPFQFIYNIFLFHYSFIFLFIYLLILIIIFCFYFKYLIINLFIYINKHFTYQFYLFIYLFII